MISEKLQRRNDLLNFNFFYLMGFTVVRNLVHKCPMLNNVQLQIKQFTKGKTEKRKRDII